MGEITDELVGMALENNTFRFFICTCVSINLLVIVLLIMIYLKIQRSC